MEELISQFNVIYFCKTTHLLDCCYLTLLQQKQRRQIKRKYLNT